MTPAEFESIRTLIREEIARHACGEAKQQLKAQRHTDERKLHDAAWALPMPERLDALAAIVSSPELTRAFTGRAERDVLDTLHAMDPVERERVFTCLPAGTASRYVVLLEPIVRYSRVTVKKGSFGTTPAVDIDEQTKRRFVALGLAHHFFVGVDVSQYTGLKYNHEIDHVFAPDQLDLLLQTDSAMGMLVATGMLKIEPMTDDECRQLMFENPRRPKV